MFERFSGKGKSREPAGGEKTMLLRVSPCLYVLSGRKKGRKYKVNKESISIGREKSNDISFENESSVSGSHARIYRKKEGWCISDAGSSNGTLVDGRKADDTELKDGAVIELGNVKLRYEEARSSAVWRLYDRDEGRKQSYRIIMLALFLIIVVVVMYLLSSVSTPKVVRYDGADTYLHYVPMVEEEAGVDDTAESHYIRGMSEYNRGNFRAAGTCWNEALKINPGHEGAGAKLEMLEDGRLESNKRRIVSAKTKKKTSTKEVSADKTKKHETAEMYYRKGRVFHAANDVKKAVYYWKKVLKIIDDPEDELYRQALEKINALAGE